MNQSCLVYDNKMWLIGGQPDTSGTKFNDVWYSTDGISWTLATAAAAFSERSDFAAVVYENEMWVIGNNDVWRSADGINWTLQTNTPAFTALDGYSATVFDCKIYVAGTPPGNITESKYLEIWHTP